MKLCVKDQIIKSLWESLAFFAFFIATPKGQNHSPHIKSSDISLHLVKDLKILKN